ncbi:LamG domain-containing protein [Myxococcota bacterium]|nr:LamG domain-containing protein [Myxococcota bacterium]
MSKFHHHLHVASLGLGLGVAGLLAACGGEGAPLATETGERGINAPVLHWPLDECTKPNPSGDFSSPNVSAAGSSHDMWFPHQTGGNVLCDVPGVHGDAVQFDGVNDQGFEYFPTNITGEVTIMGWVKPSTIQHSLVMGNQTAYEIFLNSSGTYSFIVARNTPAEAIVTSSPVIDGTNAWVHVAGVRRPRSIEIWINGQLHSSTRISNVTLPTGGSVDLSTGLFWFAGKLDDVRVYDYAVNGADFPM